MTSQLVLNVTKSELENRIQNVIETSNGSPLKKNANKVVKKAMVQLLHGGNAAGQNEHNLEQFWKEDSKTQTIYVINENIRHEDDDVQFIEYTGNSEEEVYSKFFNTINSDLAHKVNTSINYGNFFETLKESGFNKENIEYFKHSDFEKLEDIDEEEFAEFLEMSCNEKYELREIIFNYIHGLFEIQGHYELTTREEKIKEVPVVKEENKTLTLHTVITINNDESFDGSSYDIDNVDVFNTVDEKEYNKHVLDLFCTNACSETTHREILLESEVMSDAINEQSLEDDYFESFDFDKIVEWMTENIDPTFLVGLISTLSDNMTKVEVDFKEIYL